MLPIIVSLSLVLWQAQGWSQKSQTEPSIHLPFRVPFAPPVTQLDNSNAAIMPLLSQKLGNKVPLGSGPSVIWHMLSSQKQAVKSRNFLNIKNSGNTPLLTKNDVLEHKQTRFRNVQDNIGNPMVQAKHLWKREANNGDDEKIDSFNLTATENQSKEDSSFGLDEIEITVVIICSSIALLACIAGLIFLARYYWRKLHDTGYQGVLQRDSSESSVGAVRMDSKEANAKLEEMDGPNKETDALINKHQSMDVIQKAPLLPCANGTAVMEQCPIIKENTDMKKQVGLYENNLKKDDNLPLTIQEDPPLISTSTVKVSTHQLRNCAGLSQSNCSISSYTLNNPTYKYGNQTAYMSGYYGYPADGVRSIPIDPLAKTVQNTNLCTTSPYKARSPVHTTLVKESRPPLQQLASPTETTSNKKDNKDESPDTAEAEDAGVQNGTENGVSSTFDVDDLSKHSANNSLIELQQDEGSDEALQLSESGRAISLPEGFSPTNNTEADEENVKNENVSRPTDSGWGDTGKTQFRGSLPVIHLNVSPSDSGPITQRCKSTTSYPVSESASPNAFEPLQSSKAVSNLSNTLNMAAMSKLNTKQDTILT